MSACARFAIVLGVVVLTGSLLRADPPKQEIPKPLPKEVAAAWEKAGARAGWIAVTNWGFEYRGNGGVPLHPVNQPPQAGWVPGFQIGKWKEGMLKGLPVPATAFALDLSASEITDAELKGLAALQTLTALCLVDTGVTDAGLEELAALPNLSVLSLGGCRGVTGAGLKELAGCQRLTTLALWATGVTDDGMKALTALDDSPLSTSPRRKSRTRG